MKGSEQAGSVTAKELLHDFVAVLKNDVYNFQIVVQLNAYETGGRSHPLVWRACSKFPRSLSLTDQHEILYGLWFHIGSSGKDGLTITLRRSKTDQEGVGRKIGIPYGSNPETCPVRVLQSWMEEACVTSGYVDAIDPRQVHSAHTAEFAA